jgi:phosphoribosylformylglycinamidine cyclo-ligase
MNLDDLLCVGIYDNIIFNSTIDRNKKLIPGEVLKEIIDGTNDLFQMLRGYGVNIHYLGGETADVGDVVRTVAVNGTMAARWRKDRLITNDKIRPGDVIVGLAGFGQATYEKEYNSGLGSNGLTSARHDALSAYYRENFPETFEPTLDKEVTYIGTSRMTDRSPVEGVNMGKLLLSPTRSFENSWNDPLQRRWANKMPEIPAGEFQSGKRCFVHTTSGI